MPPTDQCFCSRVKCKIPTVGFVRIYRGSSAPVKTRENNITWKKELDVPATDYGEDVVSTLWLFQDAHFDVRFQWPHRNGHLSWLVGNLRLDDNSRNWVGLGSLAPDVWRLRQFVFCVYRSKTIQAGEGASLSRPVKRPVDRSWIV